MELRPNQLVDFRFREVEGSNPAPATTLRGFEVSRPSGFTIKTGKYTGRPTHQNVGLFAFHGHGSDAILRGSASKTVVRPSPTVPIAPSRTFPAPTIFR